MGTPIKGKQIEQSSLSPKDVGTSAVVGTSTVFSKEDHEHKLSTAAQTAVLATKLFAQPDQINAFSATGASDDVTAVIEALATNDNERNTVAAGLGILSTGTSSGDSTATATENYKVTIRDSGTKEAVNDGNDGEVYGVLEKTTTVWSLHYYKEDGTSYTAFSATNIDFIFAEVADLSTLDALSFFRVNQFGEMVDSNAARVFNQELVTTQNISTDVALTDTLDATPVSNASVVLSLNGIQQEQGAAKDYTITGTTITWLASSGTAVDMATTDVLVATYVS